MKHYRHCEPQASGTLSLYVYKGFSQTSVSCTYLYPTFTGDRAKKINTAKLKNLSKMSRMTTGCSPPHFILEKQEIKLMVECKNQKRKEYPTVACINIMWVYLKTRAGSVSKLWLSNHAFQTQSSSPALLCNKISHQILSYKILKKKQRSRLVAEEAPGTPAWPSSPTCNSIH